MAESATIPVDKTHIRALLLADILQRRRYREIIGKLERVFQHRQPAVGVFPVRHTAERQHKVVGIGKEIVRAEVIQIIFMGKPQGVYRKFPRMVFFFIERIFHFRTIFPSVVAEATGNIATGKPVSTEIRRGHTSGTQSYSLKAVVAYDCIHRPVVEFALFRGRHISCKKYSEHFLAPIIQRYLTKTRSKTADIAFTTFFGSEPGAFPKDIASLISTFLHYGGTEIVEHLKAVRLHIAVIPISDLSRNIHGGSSGQQHSLCHQIVGKFPTRPVRPTSEILSYGKIAYKIKVDIGSCVHIHLAYEHSGITAIHIHMA